jgi:hypothetical protein
MGPIADPKTGLPEDPVFARIPTEGPTLERWLLDTSDTVLEHLLPRTPAARLRAWMPLLMDQALTVMTRPSVRKYLLAQRETLQRSDRFARIWQEVVWTDPAFDRPGEFPMNNYAQTLWDGQRDRDAEGRLAQLSENTSLLLAVQPDCPPCEAQWRLLAAWAAPHRFPIRVIARALVTLQDGTVALPYPEILHTLQIREYPSLYLLQPESGYLTRLGAGLLSESEITARILRLIPGANPQGAFNYATSQPTASTSPTK